MNRREAITRELARLAPRMPAHERAEVTDHALGSPGLRKAAPDRAAWLSLVAYVRHVYTDYVEMLDDGYDVASARFFCREEIERTLAGWGCQASLEGDEDEDAGESSASRP